MSSCLFLLLFDVRKPKLPTIRLCLGKSEEETEKSHKSRKFTRVTMKPFLVYEFSINAVLCEDEGEIFQH